MSFVVLTLIITTLYGYAGKNKYKSILERVGERGLRPTFSLNDTEAWLIYTDYLCEKTVSSRRNKGGRVRPQPETG